MKIKPAIKPEQEIMELRSGSDALLEKGEYSAKVEPPRKVSRILVAVDFSDQSLQALECALAFAEQLKARLILLHVVEPAGYAENYLSVTPVLDETNQQLVESERERLAAVSRKRIGGRVPAEILVRMGRAHSEIPDTAKALAADLIVIATHGDTGLKQVLLGSTAERVVRQAPCPVLTVRQAILPRPERR